MPEVDPLVVALIACTVVFVWGLASVTAAYGPTVAVVVGIGALAYGCLL